MTLEDVRAELEIVDGRTRMSAAAIDAALYVDRPDHTPLSESETHATLRIEGVGVTATVDLDAPALRALVDAFEEAAP